ncbi:SIS domain-containing protein [Tunturiibacter empetritectus]|uniref:SIS domain-containing protein n=1 Tax=Tunturiibacter empetritectus TaxID=3069691 RepID=UPI003D9BFC74
MTEPTLIPQELVTFPHAMLREIYEQPQALAATIEQYVPGGVSTAETFQPVVDAIGGRERLVIAASGSSRHAGLAGEIMLEDLAGISVDVEYASEYTYRSTHTLHNPGVVVISQSGETADTLAALREAHARGLATVAITNNARSSMATEASASMPTFAGVEKAIPATKSFTTQARCTLFSRSSPGARSWSYDAPGCRGARPRASGDSPSPSNRIAGMAETD